MVWIFCRQSDGEQTVWSTAGVVQVSRSGRQSVHHVSSTPQSTQTLLPRLSEDSRYRQAAKWRQGLTCITGHVHLLVMRCRRDGDLLLVTFLNKSRWRGLEKSHTNHQIIWLRRNSTTAEAQNQRDVMKSAASGGVTGHVEERREKDVCGGMEAR